MESVQSAGAEDCGETLLLSPLRCRMWAHHDRLEDYLDEDSCRAEIESVRRHNQLIPAVGRRLQGDPDYDVEIICGARRLFVARHLNVPLLVSVQRLTDREAFIAMDAENRHRKDLSPYERGLSYARWLRKGYFNSQDEVARALQISASQVSRLLKLARLPSVVINAFASPNEINEMWGVDLADAWNDTVRSPELARTARRIAA